MSTKKLRDERYKLYKKSILLQETSKEEKILCPCTLVQKAERQDLVWFLEQDQGCKD